MITPSKTRRRIPRFGKLREFQTVTYCLDCSDIDLSNPHPWIEHAHGSGRIGVGECLLHEGYQCYLLGHSPLVLEPGVYALLAAIADVRMAK